MLHRASSSPASKASRDSQASGPALKRSNSLPAHSPSHSRPPAEVKPVRPSITRPCPDTRTPEDFRDAGTQRAAVEEKKEFMEEANGNHYLSRWMKPKNEGSRYYKSLLESRHPKFEKYNSEQKSKAYLSLIKSNPKIMVEMGKKRNFLYSVPNYATASRPMNPYEQKFLSQAMGRIREDIQTNPFHIHGESGVIGNITGEVSWFGHNPEGSVVLPVKKGDKYCLHSHPPFGEPFTSSASERDRGMATLAYLAFNNKMSQYVTNGKDILHIQPDSMELVKLHPDPNLEKMLGKFPEAFRIPEPRKPPPSLLQPRSTRLL